jgi:hypothetical protein
MVRINVANPLRPRLPVLKSEDISEGALPPGLSGTGSGAAKIAGLRGDGPSYDACQKRQNCKRDILDIGHGASFAKTSLLTR